MEFFKKSRLIMLNTFILLLSSCTVEFYSSTDLPNSTSDSISESLDSKPSVEKPSISEDNSTNLNQPPSYIDQRYELKFEDQFDGTSLNPNYWNIEYGTGAQYGLNGWGNNELEYYQTDNVSVENGLLKITAKREYQGGKNFTSGRIQTKEKIFFTYGYFEACIMMPTDRAMWPAFWLLPNNENIYGGWASSGEIDIMEAGGKNMDAHTVGNTLHFGGNWPNNKHEGKSNKIPGNGTINQFHMYGAEWTSEYIAFYIDGTRVYEITNDIYYSSKAPNNPSAPFDVDFYILLNLAVGGDYTGGVTPTSSFSSADMYVDYVKVYQLKE
ncbi:MAG: glycoside hydrolase family 16 protein [Erysipelotrichales bacterium]|nr:glycoside hydrolase family 16 protein [Erysipelotrichales bacterium]